MMRRASLSVTMLLWACGRDAPDSGAAIDVPGHNDCLAEGEEMSEETCLAVVEEAGKYATVSENKSGAEAPSDDPRITDEDYAWLAGEVKRCACSCCHTASWGGAGVYFYDLEFAPVWIDSASRWTLQVLGGWTEDPDQTLPSTDIARVRAVIEAELARREALDDDE